MSTEADTSGEGGDPREWLLTRQGPPQAPPGWVAEPVGRWTLARGPALVHAVAPGSGNRQFVHALGTVYDVLRPQDPPERTLARLLRLLREGGEDALLDALDPLGGRHVILYAADRELRVVTDAAAACGAFYRGGRRVQAVGSRPDLVSASGGSPPRRRGARAPVGIETGYRGVYRLTPNTRLAADGGPEDRIERYWPRAPLPPLDPETAARRIRRAVRGAALHLASRPLAPPPAEEPDTRAILDIFAETPGPSIAAPGAGAGAAEPSGAPAFPPRPGDADSPLAEGAVRLSTGLAPLLRGAEQHPDIPALRDAADLARLHLGGVTSAPLAQVFDLVDRCRRHAATTGILDAARLVDGAALHLWEEVMPAHLAAEAARAGASVETVSPFNCRVVVKSALAAPLGDRVRGLLAQSIVRHPPPGPEGRSPGPPAPAPDWLPAREADDLERRAAAPPAPPAPEDHPDVLRTGARIGRTKTPSAELGGMPIGAWTGRIDPEGGPARWSFEEDGFVYDLALVPREGADRLFVFFSGDAMRSRYDPPVFQRWSWARRFPGHCLYVADPACRLDPGLGLAWYAGTEGVDPQPVIARAVAQAAASLGVRPDRVAAYGSSGGGFAALRMLRALPEATAIAVNPQTEVTAYEYRNVERYLDICMGGRTREAALDDFPERLSVLGRAADFAGRRILYIQNVTDLHHLGEHYAPFCEMMGTGTEPSPGEGRFRRILFELEGGHAAAESDEALRTALAILSEEPN